MCEGDCFIIYCISVCCNIGLSILQVQQQVAAEYENLKELMNSISLFKSDNPSAIADRPLGELIPFFCCFVFPFILLFLFSFGFSFFFISFDCSFFFFFSFGFSSSSLMASLSSSLLASSSYFVCIYVCVCIQNGLILS